MNDKTLIMHYNIDSKGNPTAVKIDEENKQVSSICYCVQLRQVPDEKYRMVVIDDKGNELTEVYNFEDIGENDYYINYISSVVYFHPSKAGKTYIFSYYGLGYELVGASRIYDEKSLDGKSIIKTLQDIIDKGRECIEALSTIGNAIELLRRIENYIIEATKLDVKLKEDIRIGDILHLNLTNDISTGTTLHNNLTNDITVGTKLKTDLDKNIATGTTVNNNLKSSITEGNTTKTKLDQSIAEAQDDIATIQSTGNGTWTIPSTAWVGTAPDLTYNLKHNMNSKNLVVSVVDTTTQKSVLPDYRIVDMNNIEIQSTKAMSITVTINAKYYSGKDANIIAQEVQDARGGEVDLGVRLDKYGRQLADIVQQDRKERQKKPSGLTIVCYGDSNTRYYEGDRGVDGSLTHAYSSWIDRFCSEIPSLYDATVINAGYSGETIEYGLGNYTTNITNNNAKIAVIGFGTNNIKNVSSTMESYIANMSTMIDKLIADDIITVVLGIPWFEDSYAPNMQQRIPIWNEALRNLCFIKNVSFIDVWNIFGRSSAEVGTWFNESTTPKRHYSPRAERVLAEHIFDKIKSLSTTKEDIQSYYRNIFNYSNITDIDGNVELTDYALGEDMISTMKIATGNTITIPVSTKSCLSIYPRETSTFKINGAEYTVTANINDGLYYPIKRFMTDFNSSNLLTIEVVSGNIFIRGISGRTLPKRNKIQGSFRHISASQFGSIRPDETVFITELLKPVTKVSAGIVDGTGYISVGTNTERTALEQYINKGFKFWSTTDNKMYRWSGTAWS